MAAANAIAFPVKNQAFRLAFRIDSTSTSNPITGGLTGLAAQISKDGAAFVASTNSPVEIGTTGYGYLDLAAAELNYTSLVVRVYATNTGAMEFAKEICPLDLAPFAGRFDQEYLLKIEKLLLDVHAISCNEHEDEGAEHVVKNPDGTEKFRGFITEGDTTATRGILE